MARTLFVSWKDKLELWRVVDGIEDRKNSTARIAENVLDTMSNHHLVENLTTRHSDKRMVEGAFRVGTETRRRVCDVVPGRQLLESRCRYRSPIERTPTRGACKQTMSCRKFGRALTRLEWEWPHEQRCD